MTTLISPQIARLSGKIDRLDLLNRELQLLAHSRRTSIDIPPNCVVLLRGEPVKLRMLQPGDLIQVAFVMRGDQRVAREIQVDGSQPVSTSANEVARQKFFHCWSTLSQFTTS